MLSIDKALSLACLCGKFKAGMFTPKQQIDPFNRVFPLELPRKKKKDEYH